MDDALFSASFKGFTAQRKALARALRAKGDREGAKAAEATPKPTLSAWALNQVARTQAEDITEYLKAVDAQAAAQLDGTDARRLREATSAERGAQRVVVAHASRALEADGQRVSRASVEKIEQALRNAAFDAGGRALLVRGTLLTDFERADFAGLAHFAKSQDLEILKRARPAAAPLDSSPTTLAGELATPDQDVDATVQARPPLRRPRADAKGAPTTSTSTDRQRTERNAASGEAAREDERKREEERKREDERKREEERKRAEEALAQAAGALQAARDAHQAAIAALARAEADHDVCQQTLCALDHPGDGSGRTLKATR